VKGLRKYGVNDLCPVCRARLPAGPKAKMDGGVRLAVAAEATKDEQLRRRRWADAAVLLRQALAEDSSLARAHFALGVALFRGEADIDGAETAFRAAIQCDPQNASAYYNLGCLLVRDNRQDIDGAEAAYRAAIECDPKHVNAHCALGQLLLQHRGAFAEAEALFRRTIELAPRDALGHASLGVALGNQGDHTGAEAAFRCALAIDPTNPHAQAGLRQLATRREHEEEEKEAAAQQAMMELLLEEENEAGGGTGGGGGDGKKRGGGGKKGKKKRN
jgi:Flp pilus assembly protein TadD